jgi:hypothetical protein
MGDSKSNGKQNDEPFDWVKLEQEIRSDQHGSALIETKEQKFKRKIAANPLIPLGTAITNGVLMVGIFSFAMKKTRLSQLMMRARVIAQGGTVAALVGTVLYSATKGQPQD